MFLVLRFGKDNVFFPNKYSVFQPLRDMDVFRNISLDGWTVTWLDGAIDIAPEFLYEKGINA